MSSQRVPSQIETALWATEVCIGNPYVVPQKDYEQASSFFEKHHADIGEFVGEFCERKLPDAARRLVLAAGNAWAFTHERLTAPVEDTVTSARGREIGISATDVRRVLSAVERFYRAMNGFYGTSDAVHQVRVDTWRACFGPSLNHTLLLERTINEQNVLILGESGTGKEIIATAIQQGHLGAPDGTPPPCTTINGAAIPTELAESELFGHRKGSFTGALADREGKIVEADHGTLFIDEVADLPQAVQPKLLRVMETDRVVPVGSNREKPVHVRYVAATSKPIRELARRDEFRSDLYERLAGVVLRIPPLRERPEDIEPIARAIVRRRFEELEKNMLEELERSVLTWLSSECRSSGWEGNVRELSAAIGNHLLGITRQYNLAETAAVKGRTDDVPDDIHNCQASEERVVRWYLERVVASVGNNLSRAEKILGVDRGTIRRRLGRRSERSD